MRINETEAVAMMARSRKLAGEALKLVHSNPREAAMTLQMLVDGLDLTLGASCTAVAKPACCAAATYTLHHPLDLSEQEMAGDLGRPDRFETN
jgi:predicted ATPase